MYSIIFYTIVTENYLCFAETLRDSFLKNNINIDFKICLINDKSKNNINYNSEIITTDVLDFDKYESMRQRYDNLSLVCALKPYFADYFLKEEKVTSIVYLDADILVYNKFDYLIDLLNNDSDQSSIILTSHVLNKLGVDNMVRNINYLTYGTYNAGFFAIKNNKHGNAFIQWWKELLYSYCNDDLSKGIFYDQSWLNLVPNYFYHYYTLLTHPGYNVAYWNIDERDLSKKNNIYFCQQQPLVFYHFARFNYYDKGTTKNIEKINPLMVEIFQNYRIELKNNGIENHIKENKQKKNSYIDQLRKYLKTKK